MPSSSSRNLLRSLFVNSKLTGLPTVVSAAIAATDSVLVALGKLQAQVTAKLDKTGGALAGDLVPDTDVARSLGSTTNRFLSGFFRSIIIGGNGELNAKIDINGASSRFRVLGFLTNTTSRVLMGISDAAESSVATGSDFFIKVYNNAGAYVADAITIARTTGKTTFNTRPAVVGVGDLWATAAADTSNVANGYLKLPNGLILQWGAASGAAGDLPITFPIAFPGTCVFVGATMVDAGIAATSLLCCSTKSIGSAGFTAERRFASTGGTVGAAAEGIRWFAIGY